VHITPCALAVSLLQMPTYTHELDNNLSGKARTHKVESGQHEQSQSVSGSREKERKPFVLSRAVRQVVLFMALHNADEPTSGLDARSAQIVMRVVRNIVNNNRTIVCTIHQPSAEIFLHFDELLLLKRGGWPIYYGPLGDDSQMLVDWFESVPGAQTLSSGYNPATYMLEV
jgi:ABC-type cobalamin/Fe3+-siderophores transport system ATPase subunit